MLAASEQILQSRGASPDAAGAAARQAQPGDAVFFVRLIFRDVLVARGRRLSTFLGWLSNCLIVLGQFSEHDLWYWLRHFRHPGLCNIIHVGFVIRDMRGVPHLAEFQCPGGLRVTPLALRLTAGKGWLVPLKATYVRRGGLKRMSNGWTWLEAERGTRYNLLGLPLAILPWVPLLLRVIINLLRRAGVRMAFCSEGAVLFWQYIGVLDKAMPGIRNARFVPNACPIDPDGFSPDDCARLMIFDKSEAVQLP